MPQYELNFTDYWIILQKRRFVILSITLAIFIVSVIYSNRLPYVYSATAIVRIKEQRTLGSVLTQLVTGTISEPLDTYANVIESRPILQKAILGVADEFTSQSEIAAMAGSLRVSTSINHTANSIYISVTSKDPHMAAKIANEIVEVFIVENLREKNRQARQVREFIEKQLAQITTKLKDSEDKLKEFKEKEMPTGVAMPLQNQLIALEMRKMELLRQYTEFHPDIVNINEDINNLKGQIKNLPEVELKFSRLSREVNLNIRLYTDLKPKLEGARIAEAEQIEDVIPVGPATVPGAPISPNKQRNLLLGFGFGLLLGLVVALILEQLDTSIGTIEDVEAFLKLPVLGVIPYLEIEGERRTMISRLWPKRYKGEQKISRLKSQLSIYYPSRSAMVEAYKVIRTNIQMEIFKSEPKGKILLVSSASPEEGKTLTAANLAITFAQSGHRTLLIDGDLRRAFVHKVFGLERKDPGLTDILRGTVNLDDAIRTFADTLMGTIEFEKLLSVPGIDNLNILTCGSEPTAPAEILATGELNNLFLKLRERYDIVLVDSPPVLAVADAVILAQKTDALILVYKVGKTARSALMRAKTQLDAVNKTLCKGVILNNIAPEAETGAAYYYHYKYYGKYYGEKEGKKGKRGFPFWRKKKSSEETETESESETKT